MQDYKKLTSKKHTSIKQLVQSTMYIRKHKSDKAI